MKTLLDAGYGVSTGVLNVLDSDFENAKDLHIPAVPEVPFAAISEAAHEKNLGMIRECEAVVVSPFPVGPGNLRNMEAARAALSSGKRVVVILPDSGKSIDFVGGQADAVMKDLISSGAIPVEGIAEMLRRLQREAGDG